MIDRVVWPALLPRAAARRLLAVLQLVVALAALASAGCTPTGKPDWATRLQPAPAGVTLKPSPPGKLVWLHVRSAQLPQQSAGGIAWDDDSGPDPLVRVIADDKEILSFPAVSDSFKPSWKTLPGGNIALDDVRELRIELRDADGLNSKLVGSASLSTEGLRVSADTRTVDLSPVGRVQLTLEPAHPLLGLGFDYRVYRRELIVTDVFEHGPAGRVGIKAGDKLVKLGGTNVKAMSEGQIKSVLNTIPVAGLDAVVLHKAGTSETVKLEEGPIYALLSEYGPIP